MEKKPIILISGGTGVGTSTYSFELAKHLNITTVVGTDIIREVMRGVLDKRINPALDKSTYDAGQTANYSRKPDAIKRSEILRAYKNQSSAIGIGVEQIIGRLIKENLSGVIEGVHLRPGQFQESELFSQVKNRFFEYCVFIGDDSIHKNRFQIRQHQAPNRDMKKYVDNFNEIRWVHDYLVERASRYENIALIDNSSSLEQGVSLMIHHLQK